MYKFSFMFLKYPPILSRLSFFWFFRRNRIVAMRSPGMAMRNTLNCENKPFKRPVNFKCLNSIF